MTFYCCFTSMIFSLHSKTYDNYIKTNYKIYKFFIYYFYSHLKLYLYFSLQHQKQLKIVLQFCFNKLYIFLFPLETLLVLHINNSKANEIVLQFCFNKIYILHLSCFYLLFQKQEMKYFSLQTITVRHAQNYIQCYFL